MALDLKIKHNRLKSGQRPEANKQINCYLRFINPWFKGYLKILPSWQETKNMPFLTNDWYVWRKLIECGQKPEMFTTIHLKSRWAYQLFSCLKHLSAEIHVHLPSFSMFHNMMIWNPSVSTHIFIFQTVMRRNLGVPTNNFHVSLPYGIKARYA